MYVSESNYLIHHGIKGQKHGVRRFQNEDGSLTAEGRRRYGIFERIPGVGFVRRKVEKMKAVRKEEQKKEDKAQRKEEEDARARGYEWASKNTQIGGYYRRKMEEAQKEAEKEARGDIIDRGVQKIADNYGLGMFARPASKALKNAAAKGAVSLLEKREAGNKVADKVVSAVEKATGKTAAVAIDKAVIPVAKFTGKQIKDALRNVARGAKFIAKTTAKVGKTSYQWLKSGGTEKIHRGSHKMMKLTNQYGSMAINALEGVLKTAMNKAAGRK